MVVGESLWVGEFGSVVPGATCNSNELTRSNKLLNTLEKEFF